MKKIRIIELLHTIRANLVAFLSIAMFVCLGVGLFLGIQWTGLAVQSAADKYYADSNFHDIEISFPYGITENDTKEILAVSGVKDIDYGYTSFQEMEGESTTFIFKMQSISSKMDACRVIDGALPTKKGEAALLGYWADRYDYKVGDTFTLKHDGFNLFDDDGMKNLNADTYKVVGIVDNPSYIFNDSTAIGFCNLGMGNIDCVAFVDESSFDKDSYLNTYPNVYVTVEGSEGKSTYAADYAKVVNPIADEIRVLGDDLASQRYDDVKKEAKEQIEEARRQVEIGQKRIDKGEKDLESGRTKIREGEEKIKSSEKEYETGKEQLQTQIAEGERKLAEAKDTLDSSQVTLDTNEREYREQKSIFDQFQSEFNDIADVYDVFMGVLAKLRTETADAEAKLDKAQAAYDAWLEASKAPQQEDTGNKKQTETPKTDENDTKATEAKDKPADSDAAKGEEATGKPAETDQTTTETDAKADTKTEDGAEAAKKADQTPISASSENPAPAADPDKLWAAFLAAYGEYQTAIRGGSDSVTDISDSEQQVADHFNVTVDPVTHEVHTGDVTPENAAQELKKAATDVANLNEIIATIDGITFEAAGVTVHLTDIRGALGTASAKLAEAESALESARRRIEDGWNTYFAGQRELEQQSTEGQRKLDDAAAKIEEGKEKLETSKQEIEEGEQEIEEAKEKLEVGKKRLSEAEDAYQNLIDYEWFVFPRSDNGSVQGLDMLSVMVNKVSWAMASLFVLVGMFVCYSSVSRLVHEDITQIGTKKSLGFREGEIAFLYLSFSALSIIIGVTAAIAVAIFVVQGILLPVMASNVSLPAFGPYFDPKGLLLMGVLDAVLILGSAWFAIHTLMKKEALELLRGETVVTTKPHFWEKSGTWQNMSLYSQTIVNNVVNDKRRVLATLVGVVGCTALIVVAMTLNNNVANSIKKHYEDVYHYNAMCYLDKEVTDAKDLMQAKIADEGMRSTPVLVRRIQVNMPNGTNTLMTIIVPDDPSTFSELYQLNSMDGNTASLDQDGIWLVSSFEKVDHYTKGAPMVLAEGSGSVREIPIAGFYEFYSIRREAVMCKESYEKYFGAKPKPNVLLVDTAGKEVPDLQKEFKGSKGYMAFANDHKAAIYAFDVLSQVLSAVVVIYIFLSALMAIMVLLNLDVMYVNEKKRELIVLRINGFSVRQTKSYISRDTIVLTVIGIIIGVFVGSLLGSMTLAALEPDQGYFIKDFNLIAACVGIAGSGVFSAVVLVVSLRAIPRFDLTDINRF